MSVLPISTNRPPRGSRPQRGVDELARPASSARRPPRGRRSPPGTARSKSSVRDEAMCSSSKPELAQRVPLAGARGARNTSAPRCRASCTAAMPTPPAAACTSTDSPGRSPARSTSRSRRSGTPPGPTPPARTTSRPASGHQPCGRPRASGPKAPGNRPMTRSPDRETGRRPGPTSTHHTGALAAQRRPAPGYMPSAISTSRKFSPAARTATRTSPGASGASRLRARRPGARSSSVPVPPVSSRHAAARRAARSAPPRPARASRGAERPARPDARAAARPRPRARTAAPAADAVVAVQVEQRGTGRGAPTAR